MRPDETRTNSNSPINILKNTFRCSENEKKNISKEKEKKCYRLCRQHTVDTILVNWTQLLRLHPLASHNNANNKKSTAHSTTKTEIYLLLAAPAPVSSSSCTFLGSAAAPSSFDALNSDVTRRQTYATIKLIIMVCHTGVCVCAFGLFFGIKHSRHCRRLYCERARRYQNECRQKIR